MDPFAANETPVADDTTIIEEYPLPLARAWQRALIASPRAAFHHRQLLVAAEWLAYYLGAVAIAVYEQLRAAGGSAAPTLDRSLRNLRRPTYGQWLGWVRGALGALPAEHDLLPGLQPAYEDADRGMLLLGYEGLRAIMVVLLGYTGEYGAREAASPRLLLELINQYQLRRVKHTLPPDSGFDEMAVVSVLAPGLRACYGRLGLLAAYPLLGLLQTPDGVEVVRLQGLSVTASSVELEPDSSPPGTLLLANREELPVLVLDPWLIYAACPECGTIQIAAFAGQEGAARRYHGLECEHTWERGPGLLLAEAQVTGPGEPGGWAPAPGDLPLAPSGDPQDRLFARLEADAAALTADRRARQAARPPAPAASAVPGHTSPREVYLDLLDQGAAAGLTIDQLQGLDEERAAAAERQRHAAPDAPPAAPES